MTTKLYWNNICLVTKTEETYINNKLKEFPLPIETHYFGLGRSQSLLQHFKSTTALDCDVIVSTDTDIFHDNHYDHFFDSFEPLRKFITIPLVILYNTSALKDINPPESFQDLFSECYKDKIVYGGPHNSAGKSLVKSLWSTYGYEQTKAFINTAKAVSMPAAAFQKVMTGEFPIAIVPTIFALRAGVGKLKMVWPSDGAIPIHSYVAIKSTCSLDMKTFILDQLVGKDFQRFLVEKAAILAHDKTVDPLILEGVQSYHLMEPDWSFLKTLDHSKLYDLLPTL